MTSISAMSDEATAASLRKSGRTRKRPLPPDATYDQSPTSASKTNGIPHGSAAIPFSPGKLFGESVEQPVAGSSTATQTQNANENGNVGEGEDEDDEDEQEEEPVWAEFSADYYQGQTSQLLELIRQYANARLATIQPNADHLPGDPSKNPQTDLSQPLPDVSTLRFPRQDAMDIDPPNNLPRTPGKGPLDGGSGHIAAGPSRHVDAIPEAHTDISGNGQTSGNRLYSVKLTSNMLPQIGQLARDVLRGADEKVGIASGCYNTVDRHVRSMDAALQVQQAAVNLGIQEGTLPSEMITGSTGLGASGATRADGRDAQEAMGIFSGGRERGLNGTAGDGLAIDGLNVGLAESRMGAGRANEDDRGPIPIVAGHVAAQNFDLKVDPNEPRYCYCDNVSFGEMIGCENDDCPHGGWFHLTCVGMNTAPKDKWWCSSCKPADENALGGSSRGKKGRSKKKTKR